MAANRNLHLVFGLTAIPNEPTEIDHKQQKLYMKSCLYVNNYKHGDCATSELICDKFYVIRTSGNYAEKVISE